MPATLRWIGLPALLVFSCARSASAGMPSVTFQDVATTRLEVISFFLMGLLLSAAVMRVVWNSLGRDFPRLPRLTFFKALGIVTLWGLLFVVVLTMISGARELMTPGAWEKQGATYKLREELDPKNDPDRLLERRERHLYALGRRLDRFAASHEGKFPSAAEQDAIPVDLWELPDDSHTRYIYVPGQTMDDKSAPLAYEPTIYGDYPFVLLTTGEVVNMSLDEILRSRRTDE